ncbi:MAG TPA: hypothetical protein PLF40_29095 [Kofleriaceae bacterium]|nr:hypothetical protein [Kofleriaceae bacterium]
MINYNNTSVVSLFVAAALGLAVTASGCTYATALLGPGAAMAPSEPALAAKPARGIPLQAAPVAAPEPTTPGTHTIESIGPEQISLTLDAPTAKPGVKHAATGYTIALADKAQALIAVQMPNVTFQEELATAKLEGNVLASSEFDGGWEIDFTAGKARVKRVYKKIGATYFSCEITSKGGYSASAAVANHELCMSLRRK